MGTRCDAHDAVLTSIRQQRNLKRLGREILDRSFELHLCRDLGDAIKIFLRWPCWMRGACHHKPKCGSKNLCRSDSSGIASHALILGLKACTGSFAKLDFKRPGSESPREFQKPGLKSWALCIVSPSSLPSGGLSLASLWIAGRFYIRTVCKGLNGYVREDRDVSWQTTTVTSWSRPTKANPSASPSRAAYA